MASLIGMAKRSEAAQERIDRSLSVIVDAAQIDIAPFPTVRRDPVLETALRLEWTADVLEQVVSSATFPDVQEVQGVDLDKATRDDLNRLAADLGIEDAAEKSVYPTKAALADAIQAAVAATGDEPLADDSDGASDESEGGDSPESDSQDTSVDEEESSNG